MLSSFCDICLSTLYLVWVIQTASTSVLNLDLIKVNVTTGTTQYQDNTSSVRPPAKTSNEYKTTISKVPQHRDLIMRKFGGAEYRPRMEVVAVGLDYDNQTATMRVSVFVGIPTMNSSRNSQITEKPVLTENFTSYEIYLTALQESDLWEPPSSCLTDPFLQHSRREVVVDCPLSGGRNTSEHPTTTPNPLSPSWETSCVDPNANNFTVEFRHVHSGYYCLLIQPQAGAHTRRTFTRMLYYQTSITPTDITKWQPTIDLQSIPSRRCIAAAFTVPDSSYQIISGQIRVDLMQVASGQLCNDSTIMKLIQTKVVTMEPGKHTGDVEFFGKPPGLYCVVVLPLDERCDGNNFWKAKGRSCARHSAHSVEIQDPSLMPENNGGIKQAVVFKTYAKDAWTAFIILCTSACGLVLASLMGVVIMYHRRRKKRLQLRQHQLGLLLEWGPGGRASQTGSISADVTDVKHHLPNVVDNYSAVLTFDPEAKKNDLLTSAPISVLLLYRRDDLQIARRAVDLRIRLKSECGAKIKVHDYGDESQWEDIAVEGLDWLPNRICRNPSDNDSVKRVIVIHSPLPSFISQISKNEQNPDEDLDGSTSDPLLTKEMDDSIERMQQMLQPQGFCGDRRFTTDQEFLYGMQLLLGTTRDSDYCASPRHQSIYSRVFNVRYTDIADLPEGDKESKGLVYPNLQVAPFTCYLLPEHFYQLVQHITAPH